MKVKRVLRCGRNGPGSGGITDRSGMAWRGYKWRLLGSEKAGLHEALAWEWLHQGSLVPLDMEGGLLGSDLEGHPLGIEIVGAW